MDNNCNGNCCADYNAEDDDFEIQRLEEIISICQFLIKHKKNAKLRAKLDDILEHASESEDDEEEREYYINRYAAPIWIVPEYYQPTPWWARRSWYDHVT